MIYISELSTSFLSTGSGSDNSKTLREGPRLQALETLICRRKQLAFYRWKQPVRIEAFCNFFYLLTQVWWAERVRSKNGAFIRYDWLEKLNTKGFYIKIGDGEVVQAQRLRGRSMQY